MRTELLFSNYFLLNNFIIVHGKTWKVELGDEKLKAVLSFLRLSIFELLTFVCEREDVGWNEMERGRKELFNSKKFLFSIILNCA